MCVGWRGERTLRQRTREMVDRDRQNKCVRERLKGRKKGKKNQYMDRMVISSGEKDEK